MFFGFFLAQGVHAAEKGVPDDTSIINFYMQCWRFEIDFFKQEINYVNFVSDRLDADIVLIISSDRTGSTGREYSLFFTGDNRFAGRNDTISFSTNPDETDDIVRNRLLNIVQLGLVPYMMQTPLINEIELLHEINADFNKSVDRWNYWVFRTDLEGAFQKEQSVQNLAANAGFSGRQITEKRKLRFSGDWSYNSDEFEIDDEIIVSTSQSYSLSALSIWSLNDHWSAGISADQGASDYANVRSYTSFSPAIEYNVFPYSEVSHQELRISYRGGYSYIMYYQETIYDKMEEGLWFQSIGADLNVIKPWGNVGTALAFQNFLNDFSKNSFNFELEIGLRIFKGFFIVIEGGIQFVHDQISLPKAGIAPEDILLQRRELETQSRTNLSIGIQYTFGALYNNVVNSRFGF